MKNQKMIDAAFAELKKGGEWYEVNNLIYDISDKKERQYLFDNSSSAICLIPNLISLLPISFALQVE